MVRKLNGYLLKKKLKHKYLVKCQSFSGAKRSSMVDHVKPIIRDDKLDHVILHARPYGLRSGKSSSRITKSIISLIKDRNSVIVFSIVLRFDDLNK